MATQTKILKPFRSVFFVPGDSEKKLAKSLTIPADAIVYDLEDSVLPDAKPKARELVLQALEQNRDAAFTRMVRINPLTTSEALPDLAAIVRGRPDVIMQPKIRSVDDVNQLAHYLDALEAREGLEPGAIKILPLASETPEVMFALGSLQQASERLIGLTWGAEDLSSALGASTNKGDDGDWAFPYKMARAQCLMAARAAGVQPIDTIYADFRDPTGLKASCIRARKDGYTGKMAIHPAQVEVINEAFTPSAEEVAFAKAVLQKFADNPEAGVVQLDGKMLDIPHLNQARNVIAQAEVFGV